MIPIAPKPTAGSIEADPLYRRAYQVGYMTNEIETALLALDRGDVEWVRRRLTRALEVARA